MNPRYRMRIVCLLAAAWPHVAVAVGCEPLTTTSPHYDLVVSRTAELFPHPPVQVSYCGLMASHHLWKASWGVYEAWGAWKKSGSASCRAEPQEPLDIWSCSKAIQADREDGLRVQLTHEIGLDVLDEIVNAVAATIPPRDRVISIEYTAVPGGGAWSVSDHGYHVSTSRGPGHGSGEMFQVVRDCAPSPCHWQVLSTGGHWVN